MIHSFISLNLGTEKKPIINHFAVIDARDIAESDYHTFRSWLTLQVVTEETAAMPLETEADQAAVRTAMYSANTPTLKIGRIERETATLYVKISRKRSGDLTVSEVSVSPHNYGDLTDAARATLEEAFVAYVSEHPEELPAPRLTDEEARVQILNAASYAGRSAVYDVVKRFRESTGTNTSYGTAQISRLLEDPETRAQILSTVAEAFTERLSDTRF